MDIKMKIRQGLKRQQNAPVSSKILFKNLHLKNRERVAYEKALGELIASGEVRERRGKLLLRENSVLQGGEIVKVNATYGFARLEGSEEEVFIPGRFMKGAMPGDKVQMKVRRSQKGGDLKEGEVMKVTETGDYVFTGVLTKDGKRWEIVPDHSVRIPIPVRVANGAKEGDKVLAELSHRGGSHFDHKAEVLESFGSSQDAESCTRAILAEAGVDLWFSDEVLEHAEKMATGPIFDEEVARRLDLKNEKIFTIDSADSKDLDDAISLEKLPEGGWKLGVHIADVSYYVTHDSPVDKEAFERGTSIYYADSVVPMLPQVLSNGICSLTPDEPRMAFSVYITLDKNAKMVKYRFDKSVIQSRVKGVYSEVNAILDKTAGPELLQKYDGLVDTIFEMEELAKVLMKQRASRGGLDLESVESKIILDENRVAVDIIPRERGFSEQIIEEFMLLANQAAASFGMEREVPFIYRVHDKPTAAKIETLRAVLDAVGIDSSGLVDGATPTELYKVLEAGRGTPVQKLVNNTMLRSMAKAKYSEHNIGHFGLVMQNYSHFTSPIRRYPDLVIHRIMTSYLYGMKRDNIEKRYREFVAAASAQSSGREVRAMQIERDCEDCYKAEYMKQFIGEEFDGIIGSVTSHGIYVELPNTVEGLIRNADLPEGEYEYDGVTTLNEMRSGATYRVGDAIRIKVLAANVSAGNIDFGIAVPATGE